MSEHSVVTAQTVVVNVSTGRAQMTLDATYTVTDDIQSANQSSIRWTSSGPERSSVLVGRFFTNTFVNIIILGKVVLILVSIVLV